MTESNTFINLVELTLSLCVLMPLLMGLVSIYVGGETVLIDVPESVGVETPKTHKTTINTQLIIMKASKTMHSQDLTQTIALAREIADNRHDNKTEPMYGPLYGDHMMASDITYSEFHITDIINEALRGVSIINHPNMWAVIAECQQAKDLLDKSEASLRINCWVQSNDYREGAKRRVSEAVSWLL